MGAAGLIGEHTYTWRDVSFSYPAGFHARPPVQPSVPSAQVDAVVFSDSGILFQVLAYDLPEQLAAGNDIPDSIVDDLAKELEIATGFEELTHEPIAGLPTLRASSSIRARSFAGAEVQKTTTWTFDAAVDLIYVVACQYEEQYRSDVEAACDQVLSTFELER